VHRNSSHTENYTPQLYDITHNYFGLRANPAGRIRVMYPQKKAIKTTKKLKSAEVTS